MSSKLLRLLILIPVALIALFEIVCWLFMPFPVEPLRQLTLNNDIPGFKKDVKLIFGNEQVRYLDWTPGDKPEGSVRVLCVGGWSTLGMLQAAQDTWWGQLHTHLEKSGLKVEMAARGFERTGIVAMAAATAPLIERLKPDVIILNTGFDDVIVHPATFTYDASRSQKVPEPVKESGLKAFLTKYSQTVRFKRWWSKDTEAKKMQNELGRKDVYKKFFDEKRELISKLPRHEGILRTAGSNDPLPEYKDGLALFRDLSAKAGATLVLTGEACLHDSVINFTQENSLLAYIALTEPTADGSVSAARPDPAWVMNEMNRFANAAESFASENKLTWFNLNGQVERSADNFFSDVLLTDAGAASAGKLLAPVIEPVVRAKAK